MGSAQWKESGKDHWLVCVASVAPALAILQKPTAIPIPIRSGVGIGIAVGIGIGSSQPHATESEAQGRYPEADDLNASAELR
jgi:hypothetical protein